VESDEDPLPTADGILIGPTPINSSLESTPQLEQVRVGMVNVPHSQVGETYNRFVDLGIQLAWLSTDASMADIFRFDVVYLPSTWAQNSFEEINNASVDYLEYVRRGGGIIIEEPNPYKLPDNQIQPEILPFPVLFSSEYTDVGFAVPQVTNHFLTQGISPSELPRAIDTILAVDPAYTILAASPISSYPTLAVLEYGDGRIIVTTGTASPITGETFGDEFIRRMFQWASSRD
jgi:hypothetical protein